MKRKQLLALLCAAMMLVFVLAACGSDDKASPSPSVSPSASPSANVSTQPKDEPFSGADFSGAYDFVKLDLSQKSSASTFELELADFDGTPALKVSPKDTDLGAVGKPYFGVSLDGLLAEGDIAKVAAVVFTVGVKGTDGEFYPTAGELKSFIGADLSEKNSGKWAINSADTNPKLTGIEQSGFVAGANNYVLISPKSDDGTRYLGHSDLYLLNVGFKDASGKYLPVDTSAAAAFPEGYGAAAGGDETAELDLLAALGVEYAPGAWNFFAATKGDDATIAWDILAKAKQLVIETDTPLADVQAIQGGNISFVAQYPPDSGWDEQKNGASESVIITEGKITFLLPDMSGIAALEAGDDGKQPTAQLVFANWDSLVNVTGIKLVYSAAPSEIDLLAALGVEYAPGAWNFFTVTKGEDEKITWAELAGATKLIISTDTPLADVQAIAGGNISFVAQYPPDSGWDEQKNGASESVIITEGKITFLLPDMSGIAALEAGDDGKQPTAQLVFANWDSLVNVTGITLVTKG
ncbi:hypothetical protein FACS18949_03840 [Clostridia bacterium]|nr:hypothetical protein FACS18949_03840 [Clostridia bacterium]